jgi:Na+(H+)/acetate symporter ActP
MGWIIAYVIVALLCLYYSRKTMKIDNTWTVGTRLGTYFISLTPIANCVGLVVFWVYLISEHSDKLGSPFSEKINRRLNKKL